MTFTPLRLTQVPAPTRNAAAERWLLLLGIVAAIVIAVAMVGAWPLGMRKSEPIRPMTMAKARASNAAVRIEWQRLSTAARYRFEGGSAGREQAVEGLAAAALYEAGDKKREQRAVI